MEGVQGRQGTLSRREQEVAALVAEGLTNRAIAERMFISERTVDGHLEHIREKLGVSNRAQVATWFVSQSQAAVAGPPVAAVSPTRAPRVTLWLPVAAVVVVALVAGLLVYQRLNPTPPIGPAITVYSSNNPGDRLHFPWAVALGPDNSVYIADQGDLAIRRVDPSAGAISTFAGGLPITPAFQFQDGQDRLGQTVEFVVGIAVAPDGSGLYFSNHFMVGRIAPDGTMHFVAGSRTPFPVPGGSPFQGPGGLAFAPDGTLYICDLVGNQVWKRTPDGTLTVFAGTGKEAFDGDGGPASAADLDRPHALAVEPDGDVLIADTGNNRIREVIHGSNVIETVAGSGDYYGFFGDGGPATQAKLSLPWGVATGPDGTIYIADAGNNRVRSVNAKGIIATVVHADLDAPTGLAVTRSGDLYIVDLGGHWLRRLLLTGGSPT